MENYLWILPFSEEDVGTIVVKIITVPNQKIWIDNVNEILGENQIKPSVKYINQNN